MDDVISVILGGGAGSRLFPLTLHRAKPAVPIAGKFRLIDIPIANCINAGISRIFVLTQFNSAGLHRHILNTYRFDSFRSGFVTILAAEQTPSSCQWFQGTADAVRKSLRYLEAYPHQHTLILSGDQLYKMNFQDMFAHHLNNNADLTIASTPVYESDASRFGILKANDKGLITNFYEKPAPEDLDGKQSRVDQESNETRRVFLASLGIYIFRKEVLHRLLHDSPESTDFGKQIVPQAIQNQKVMNYPFAGYWCDVGTISEFHKANVMLASSDPKYNLHDPCGQLYSGTHHLSPAKIERSYVDTSLIAEGCIISGSHISQSVIGYRTCIQEDTYIKNAVFMGADFYPWQDSFSREPFKPAGSVGVGSGSEIENVIVDKNVSIGNRCIIKNCAGVLEGEGENYYIREGIVVIPKNAIVPDDTII